MDQDEKPDPGFFINFLELSSEVMRSHLEETGVASRYDLIRFINNFWSQVFVAFKAKFSF